ncbi:MAG: asparagine synthase (glutamine-hydrolyzing) [Tepidisphaeraceae bacterium]
MCGLTGVVAFDRSLAVDRPTLARMSAAIAHRGPDGEGTWFSDDSAPAPAHVALAHRRLAVLDPDPRSNQPFTDGCRWLVYNGELYNFRELKTKLSPRDWKTTGDTEVVLAAYETWGEKCIDQFNGMFALAIWDGTRHELFLSRDRMGQKPLYVATLLSEQGKSRAVAFASEITALLQLNWVDRTIDRSSLVDYLRWGYVPTPRTIYRGITQLMPAEAMTVSESAIHECGHYYAAGGKFTDDQIPGKTRHLVLQAVQRQLVSDVPLGCFLSGGIDSSIIAAAAAAAAPKDQKLLTFSIGFDDPRYDETQFAAAVAKHLGTEHRSFTVRPDAAADLPKIAQAFGQPMADSSALPTYYLSRETRRHVTVALSGDGGDELFGGYDRYRAMRLLQRTGTWPWLLIGPLMKSLPATHPKSAAARLKRLAAAGADKPATAYAAMMRLTDESLLTDLLATPPDPSQDCFEIYFNSPHHQNRGAADAAMALDRATYLPDDLLTKVDRCSMHFALEVRSPFMDPDLMMFASQLNADHLLRGGGKRPLRQAFAADLPAWVFKRRKMGFAVPIGDWLRDSLRPMLHDLLYAANSFATANFRPAPLARLLAEHHDRRADHSQRLYALLMLELWWKEQNGDAASF